MAPDPLIPAVVLIAPREQGNIGAAARAMANMGLHELVLVDPAAPIGRLARAFAVGGGHILDDARITDTVDQALAPYHRIVGTTSARGRELPMPLLTPRELPAALAQEPPTSTSALLFGPEDCGLDNEQIARCGFLIRVPCAARQPTLNLAQAVLVVTYELYLARLAGSSTRGLPAEMATNDELDGLFSQLVPVLAGIGFARDDTFQGVLRDLRRLAARSGATRREVSILRGICRRAQRMLERG